MVPTRRVGKTGVPGELEKSRGVVSQTRVLVGMGAAVGSRCLGRAGRRQRPFGDSVVQ